MTITFLDLVLDLDPGMLVQVVTGWALGHAPKQFTKIHSQLAAEIHR